MSGNQRSKPHNSNAKSPSGSHLGSTIDAELNTFFPFDPYKLPLSASHVQDIYREWSAVAIQDEEEDEEDDDSNSESEAEDDEVLNSSHLPQSIPGAVEIDITGGLSNSFGGMSISPVQPFISPLDQRK